MFTNKNDSFIVPDYIITKLLTSIECDSYITEPAHKKIARVGEEFKNFYLIKEGNVQFYNKEFEHLFTL